MIFIEYINTTPMQYQTAPAMGERRAISGYKVQYEIGAVKIHQAIRQKTLQSIRIADPNAGRVDDFQLQTSSQIDAFQIKWSAYPGLLTLNNLVTSQKKGSPCLINQLADGWKKLKTRYPEKKIIVHLITCDHPSSKGKIIQRKNNSFETNHFAGFITHIWQKAHDSTFRSESDIPTNWKGIWVKLQRASELNKVDFFEFVRSCELEFGYEIPEFEEYSDLERQAIQSEVSQIIHLLFLSVADPKMIIEISTIELLRKLGWEQRADLINIQNFRVDETQYCAIEGLDHELETIISKTTKGYIAVIGTPGSGKSTFLTQVLKNREELVIKYYSFIPDSIEPINLRGESKNFLHDVIFQLEKEGISHDGSIGSLDREVLLRRFFNQMKKLNENWKRTGRKTIFLVDGLDHITREQRPVCSLLDDLPIPESIPDGIIFILGSQTETIFSSRIRADIRNRKIMMKSLSRQATYEIVKNSFLKFFPNDEQITKIFCLSSGHPLALRYILNKINEVKSPDEITIVLDGIKAYEGNIELQYQSYFDDIQDDLKLFELLGLISRCKGDIDLLWFEDWYDNLSIINLRNKFSHYFEKDDNVWSFFHNSFKRFVFERTSESDPGNVNSTMSIKFYKKLAEKASESPSDSPHSWDEIFYLSRAEQHQKIIEIATRARYEKQMCDFRPIYEIREDIDLALNAAREQKNIVAFIRFILLGSEFEQRDGYIKDVSYFRLLFSLFRNDVKVPLKHILSGNQLKVKNEISLKLSRELRIMGHITEAQKIFELSEPVEILNATAPIKNPQKYENPSILIEWTRSAGYFQDIDKTIAFIKKCQQMENFSDRDSENSIKSLQKRLLHALGISLIEQKRWADVLRIQTELSNYFFADSLKFNLLWNSWEVCFRNDDPDKAKEFLELGKADIGQDYLYPNSDSFNPGKITRVALGICVIDEDLNTAKEYMKNIHPPEIDNSNFSTKAGLDPFRDLIHYLKVQFYLNEQYIPEKILQLAGTKKSEISDEFKIHLYSITYISTMGDRGEFLPVKRINELVSPALKFFYRNYFPDFQNQDSGFVIAYSKVEFYGFLTNAVSKHGPEAVNSLCSLLDAEWNNSENEKYWPSEVWRRIINIINHRHADKKWCENKLLLLQNALLIRPNEYADAYARVHEYLNQATSWKKLKNVNFSKRCLSRMFQSSFGIGFRKDYQLNSWIEWLDTINDIEKDKRLERTLEFVNYIQVLYSYVEKRADEYAAEELIRNTFSWSPRHSLILTNWFLEKEIISHQRAKYIYLLQILKSQEDIPLESVIPYVDGFLFYTDDIEGVYREIIGEIITRSFQKDVRLGRKITRHFLSSIERSILEKNKPQWKLIIADQLKNLGINPQFFKLSIKKLETEIKSYDTNSIHIDDSIPKELLKFPIDPDLLIAKMSELQYRQKWEPVILKHLNSFSKKELLKILEATENPDLTVLLAQRLLELNDFKNTIKACQKTIKNCPFGGYGLPMDYGSKVDSIKIISKVDPEKAKEIFFDTVYTDLTSSYPYYLDVGIRINDVVTQLFERNQIKEVWTEIQEYLNALFSEYSIPNEIPSHFYDRMEDSSPVVAFPYFQRNF